MRKDHRNPGPQASLSRSAKALSGLMIIAFFFACDRDSKDKNEEDAAPRPVRVVPVERDDLVESVALVGELQGIEEVRVLAMVSDTIRRIPVREGDTVKAGDVLAIVSSAITSRAVAQAEAGLEAATASRDALEREVARIRPLVEGGSAPRSQLEALEAQLRGARAQVRQAAAGAGQASVQQGRTVIRSPIAGLVTGINVQEGEIAAPSMPLLTVVRPDQLKVVIRAPERHFVRIEEGMRATVSPIAGNNVEVEASVSLRGPVVDRMTRTGLVEVALDNTDSLLIPGTLVRTNVELSRKQDVLLVPAEAILFTAETEQSGEAIAFVAEDNAAKRRDIVLGARQGDRIEVKVGLSEGELLISRGVHFLRDGQAITIIDSLTEKKPESKGIGSEEHQEGEKEPRADQPKPSSADAEARL